LGEERSRFFTSFPFLSQPPKGPLYPWGEGSAPNEVVFPEGRGIMLGDKFQHDSGTPKINHRNRPLFSHFVFHTSIYFGRSEQKVILQEDETNSERAKEEELTGCFGVVLLKPAHSFISCFYVVVRGPQFPADALPPAAHLIVVGGYQIVLQVAAVAQ